MIIALWSIGLLLLAAWSALLWGAHAAWSLIAGMPWAQALQQLQAIEWRDMLGPVFGPWLGAVWDQTWDEWVGALAPLAQWLSSLVGESAGWIDAAVVVALWVTWAAGSATLLVTLVGATLGVRWWRRQRAAAQPAA